jgi:hypothetical protein
MDDTINETEQKYSTTLTIITIVYTNPQTQEMDQLEINGFLAVLVY